MNDLSQLERKANSEARELMGGTGWITIILCLVVIATYITTLFLLINEQLTLSAAYIIVSLSTYVIYTVMHDAVHGSIQGKNKNLSWLNNGLGYLAGQILFISFKVHQSEHLAHHRNTNNKNDPDLFVKDDSLNSLLTGTLVVVAVQYKYFFSKGLSNSTQKEKLIVLLEVVIMIAWRAAFIVAGMWWEALVLFVFGTLSGIFLLVILFVWLVHRPNVETERYKNTTTFVFPSTINRAITWAWLYQNYHSVHHLFPRVPFYNYKKLYEQIEPIMVANQAPIVRIGTKQVTP